LKQKLQVSGVLFHAFYCCHRLALPLDALISAIQSLETRELEIDILLAQLLCKLDRFEEADRIYEALKTSGAVDPTFIEINQSAYRNVASSKSFEILFNAALREENTEEAIQLLEQSEQLAVTAGEDIYEIQLQLAILKNESSFYESFDLKNSHSVNDLIKLNNLCVSRPTPELAHALYKQMREVKNPVFLQLTLKQQNDIKMNLLKLSLFKLAPYCHTSLPTYDRGPDYFLTKIFQALKEAPETALPLFEKTKDKIPKTSLMTCIRVLQQFKLLCGDSLAHDGFENSV
jgi:hypothetical protein